MRNVPSTFTTLPRAVVGMGSIQCTCDSMGDDAEMEGNICWLSNGKSNCGRVTSLQTSLCSDNCPCCVIASFHKRLSKSGLPDPIRKALRASNPLLHPTNNAKKGVGGGRLLEPDATCILV